MRGHQHRHALLGTQPARRLQNALLRLGVEVGERFIQQQHAHRVDQRLGDARPLALPAGERVHAAFGERLHFHRLQRRIDGLRTLLRTAEPQPPAFALPGRGDIAAHPQKTVGANRVAL